MGGAVCTFYELTEGDESAGQPFHGLDKDTLVKALRYRGSHARVEGGKQNFLQYYYVPHSILRTLELQKKAELFAEDEGVKFF